MTKASEALRAALARYAERFHADVGGVHHVASPLGAWLLLALCAPAAEGRVRDEIAEALGLDVHEATRIATDLLDHPHPLVGCAGAIWHRLGAARGLPGWLAGLPASVPAGPLPDQAGLDAWAREHTLGLIDRFPLPVTGETLLVLATALATRVSWQRPFDLVPAAALGPDSTWAGRVGRVLRTPAGPEHDQYIAVTGRAGEVAVHVGLARPGPDGRAGSTDLGGRAGRDGLAVVSVIADRSVPAADVLAAAYELAPVAATGGRVVRRSLFDLPLGEAPLWRIREERVELSAPGGREQVCTAALPAWSARSSHDLVRPVLGLPGAAQALASLLGLGEYGYAARQSAMARFGRIGFEAGAVSALAVALAFHERVPGVRRVAELRFGHPYAVIAVATGPGPWHGLPVFSAWLSEVEEPEDEPGRPG